MHKKRHHDQKCRFVKTCAKLPRERERETAMHTMNRFSITTDFSNDNCDLSAEILSTFFARTESNMNMVKKGEPGTNYVTKMHQLMKESE